MMGLTFSPGLGSLIGMNPTPIRLVVCFFILGVAGSGSAQFVAFNDANPGTGTHPNATTYGGINNTAPFNLKDIVTGASLGARLQIGRMGSGGIGSSICCAVAPAANSPAANTFGAYAAFPGGDLVYLNTSFSYIQSFSGLDPAREYSLRATVCARNPPQDAWLLVDLQGASAATRAHSPGCLSKTNFPSLRERQVLFHAFTTNAPAPGEMVGWDHVRPGSNGTFSIVSLGYLGPLPTGFSQGADVPVLSKMRLEEQLPAPVAEITDSRSRSVFMKVN